MTFIIYFFIYFSDKINNSLKYYMAIVKFTILFIYNLEQKMDFYISTLI